MSGVVPFDEAVIRIVPMREEITVETIVEGITSVKRVSPDDIADCFRAGMKSETTVTSGFLPENCLSFAATDYYRTIVLRHPYQRVDFTYHKTVYENFPLPRLVFSFTVDPVGKTSKHRMAIVADERPTPKTQIFEYPFSNVYRNCGICIGAANNLPMYKNLRTIATLPHLILSLPNNDHNFNRGNNKLKLGYRELLEHLADKEPSYYYEKVLIPRKDMTLKHFIEEEME